MKIVKTKTAKMWLRKDRIVEIVLTKNAEETLVTAKENVHAIKNLWGGVCKY